jgi:hypothetical protein
MNEAFGTFPQGIEYSLEKQILPFEYQRCAKKWKIFGHHAIPTFNCLENAPKHRVTPQFLYNLQISYSAEYLQARGPFGRTVSGGLSGSPCSRLICRSAGKSHQAIRSVYWLLA